MWWMPLVESYLLHLWLIFFNLSDCVCSFLAGECGCLWLGICFVFYRAVSRVKRWEGDNCGGWGFQGAGGGWVWGIGLTKEKLQRFVLNVLLRSDEVFQLCVKTSRDRSPSSKLLMNECLT